MRRKPSMYCWDCGHALDGLEGTDCPECGRPFDPADFESFKRGLVDAAQLQLCESIAEAYLLRSMLERAGIPAMVEEHAAGLLEAEAGVVWINREDLEAARELITAHMNAPKSTATWTCPACGEQLDPEFDICWNCQTERPE
jgi:predicted RNA-binding Zn-ribbon protein involved in translation (DUF1610 family)